MKKKALPLVEIKRYAKSYIGSAWKGPEELKYIRLTPRRSGGI